MAMDIMEGLALLNEAQEKREEEKAWQMWLAKFPYMDKKSFIPFSEFYQKMSTPQHISQRSAEEILADAHNIRSKLKK
jgi:hypothetical protein